MDCPRWNECSAPLCPLDTDSLRNGSWYADEPVCGKKDAPDWVGKQKKIARSGDTEKEYRLGDLMAEKK